jgi:hypothetical protein
MQRHDRAVARGVQGAFDRIDGDTVTEDAAAEDGVGNIDQRHDPAGEWGVKDDRRARDTSLGNCGGEPGHGNLTSRSTASSLQVDFRAGTGRGRIDDCALVIRRRRANGFVSSGANNAGGARSHHLA